MHSKATTVAAYLAELPPDRRAVIEAVRAVILKNLDADYEERMGYGMITYVVPHRVFPPGYHCDPKQPLPFACLASQKNHLSLYLMAVYGHAAHAAWFHDAWRKTGKKLDMGKSCVRFKKLDDLPLDVIGEAIRRVPAKTYIANYVEILEGRGMAGPATESATKKAAPKKRARKPATTAPAKKAAKKRAPRKTKRP